MFDCQKSQPSRTPAPGTRVRHPLRFGAVALCLAALAATPVQAQETFKVGIVSFLSGQAAESFGIPAVNGAKVLLDAFNKGSAPAPYNKAGFGGMKLEFVYVDENGGATTASTFSRSYRFFNSCTCLVAPPFSST